jgi:hypothetical protein
MAPILLVPLFGHVDREVAQVVILLVVIAIGVAWFLRWTPK